MQLKNTKDLKLIKKSFIIDIGSNDGVALKPLKNWVLKNTWYRAC